jgi:hypothetical protein
VKLTSLTCATLLIPSLAFAARPFVTDDARLTTSGSCQLESWTRFNRGSTEIWALPACNPTGNFEVTLGGGRAKPHGEPATADYILQAKTLFRALQPNGWGWGLAAGTIRHPEISPGPNMLGNTYAYVPMSFSLNNDAVVVHANLGWLRDKASSRNNASWGVGGEFKLRPALLGIAETFGDNRGMSYGQVGVRYSVVPDLFQVDATLGRQLAGDGNGRWVSFGLRYTPDRLF